MTCPHCWHEFAPEDVLWIAEHADLVGDPVAGVEAPLRFRPSRFNVRGDALDAFDVPCQSIACPRCHLAFPRALTETPPLFVSIVGAPATGKSHFLASAIWQLRRLLPHGFGVSFSDADTVANQVLNEYEETLFLPGKQRDLVAIRKTELQGDLYHEIRLAQQDVRLPKPFLFALRRALVTPTSTAALTTGTRGAPKPHPEMRILCVYDNAGEHFQPGMDSTACPATQHLAKSRAIMFLYDPIQHPRFRERCRTISNDPQLQGTLRPVRQELLLTEAALRIRKYAGLGPQRKLNGTLLVVISKADVWLPLIGANALDTEPLVTAKGASSRAAGVDLTRIESVSGKLRAFLMNFAPELIAAAEDFWTRVVYLPVSALGRGPEIDARTGGLGVPAHEIRPRWVTAPWLYVLSACEPTLLPGVRSR